MIWEGIAGDPNGKTAQERSDNIIEISYRDRSGMEPVVITLEGLCQVCLDQVLEHLAWFKNRPTKTSVHRKAKSKGAEG